MPDPTDAPPRPIRSDPDDAPLDETPGMHSSLDAPPPPFQLGAPPPPRGSQAGRTRPVALEGRSRSRASPRVKPASVRMAPAEPPPTPAVPDAPTTDELRPERPSEDETNPGAIVAVVVSLIVSMLVFVFEV